MDIEIRPETPADVETIDRVIQEAFASNAHSSGTEQLIVRQLRRSGALTLSLVASWTFRVVGHVAISPVTLADRTVGWFGLGPLAVLPQEQGRGVGRRLVEEALGRLKKADAAGCVVVGEPGYYGRFGFLADAEITLPGVPPAYFQVLRFSAGRAQGAVSYHSAFSAAA